MNAALVAAAGLVIVLGAAHSYLGERYILVRLFRRSDLPHLFGSDRFTRRTLRFAWHLTTVAWWGFAALLLLTARADSGTLTRGQAGSVVVATALISAVVALVASRGRHLSWAVLLAIAALTWYGIR